MLIDDLMNDFNNYDFSLKLNNADNVLTDVITNDYFYFRLFFVHSERELIDKINSTEIFHNVWNKFIENQGYNYQRIFTALTEDYDALENYNGIEEKTDTFNKEYGKTKDENHTSNSENNLNVFNSESLTNINKETINNKIQFNDNDTETGTITTTINKHGNLGVTTPFQMIEGEKKLRMNSLADTIIDSFIDLVSFY